MSSNSTPRKPAGPKTEALTAALREDPRFPNRDEEHLAAVAREVRDEKPHFDAKRFADRVKNPGVQTVVIAAVKREEAAPESLDQVPKAPWWTLLPVITLFVMLVSAALLAAFYELHSTIRW